jgi:Holliday junction DNA helicase RuvB
LTSTTRLDRLTAVLSALTCSFGGGRRCFRSVVAGSPTVEEVCEPFLVRAGMLARTPRGRVATAKAWTHLGMTPPSGVSGFGQQGLFE